MYTRNICEPTYEPHLISNFIKKKQIFLILIDLWIDLCWYLIIEKMFAYMSIHAPIAKDNSTFNIIATTSTSKRYCGFFPRDIFWIKNSSQITSSSHINTHQNLMNLSGLPPIVLCLTRRVDQLVNTQGWGCMYDDLITLSHI